MNWSELCIEKKKAGGQVIFRRENPNDLPPEDLAVVSYDQTDWTYHVIPTLRRSFVQWVEWNFLPDGEEDRDLVDENDVDTDGTLYIRID